jgi:hypothetical protein
MQQGGKSQRHSFQVRRISAVIPLLYNGSTRIGLLVSFRPFNSEVHSTSALLPCLHHDQLGSLEIALKRTRPCQRFWLCCWAGLYDGGREMSRGRIHATQQADYLDASKKDQY